MEYWSNFQFRNQDLREEWKEKCKEYLYCFINSDEPVFLLLQEINPYYLFGLEYREESSYKYSKKLLENVLLIYNEIPSGKNTNPWGNAIIFNTAYKDCICSLDANKNKKHYERNGFMCYTFELFDGNKITIINFYNKAKDNVYPMLDVDNNLFEIENDIKEVLNKNNNLIIFAGDFNTESNNSDYKHIHRYIKLCEKLSGFVDISNGNPYNNKNTTFWYDNIHKKEHFLRNDFCFVNKLGYIKQHSVIIENEWSGDKNNKKWKGLSDHCPIIISIEY
jgi:exonuclease III